jgi:hypothetical protein
MLQSDPTVPVPISGAVAIDEDQWNYIVVDACAQANVITSKVAIGADYLFEQAVWVGDGISNFRFDNYRDSV